MKQQPALNVTLNRLVAEGVLRRLSKGRFYREKVSVFGPLPPSETEVVKDFLAKNGKTVGYITGTQAFAEMGLTTQISSRLLVVQTSTGARWHEANIRFRSCCSPTR